MLPKETSFCRYNEIINICICQLNLPDDTHRCRLTLDSHTVHLYRMHTVSTL